MYEKYFNKLREECLIRSLWCGLVDFVTVYNKDDVRFSFKNGQEIRA